MKRNADIDRRLLAGSLLASSLAAGRAQSRMRTRGLDTTDPRDVGKIFRKLAYATDDRIGFWWLRATRYAVLKTRLIPMWEMHIGSAFQVKSSSEEGFTVNSFQASFYTDLASGELLNLFSNPFTGKSVTVPRKAPVRTVALFDKAGTAQKLGGSADKLTRQATTGPAWIEGDKVWVQSQATLSEEPVGEQSENVRVNDLTTYFGSLRDVEDNSNRMTSAGQTFSDLNAWPAWLGMGNREGLYYSRGLGFKVASFSAMPKKWKMLMQKEYPSMIGDIPGFLRSGD